MTNERKAGSCTGQRLRICLLANARAVHTKRWAEAYAARGYEVHLLSIRAAELDHVQVHTLSAGPRNSASRLWTALSYLRLLLAAPLRLRRLAPDVVHAHYTISHGVIAAAAGVRPVLLTAWGSDVIWGGTDPMPWWQRLLNRYALTQADAVTSASRFMVARIRELAPAQARVIHVPFGVDVASFRPWNETRSRTDELRIGFVKGLDRKYGPEFVIRAMPRILRAVPRAKLVLAGRGPLAAALRSLAEELGLAKHVEFLGFVPHEEVPRLLNSLDIFVNSSVVPESFGVAVLEASACGLPVVATEVGGVPEVCRGGETGLMVPPGDPDALADAIIRLAREPALRRNMGEAGRRFVESTYRWEDSIHFMTSLLHEIPHPRHGERVRGVSTTATDAAGKEPDSA